MRDPVPFLLAVGQAWAAAGLYAESHPARVRSLQGSVDALQELLEGSSGVHFSFVGGEVIVGNRILRDLRDWDWAAKLAALGVERLEFHPPVPPEALNRFLVLVLDRLKQGDQGAPLAPESPETGIRFGRLSIGGETPESLIRPGLWTTVEYNLAPEVEAVRWMQDQVASSDSLPVVETETVVRSLALAMRQQGELLLPLIALEEHDQYAVSHSCNVSVLAMGLADYLGYAPREARAIGVAAMLADLGNIRVPREILLKAAALDPAERALVEAHCTEGARMILERHPRMELAAVVAYEHHLDIDGSGYPATIFRREPHFVSRLDRICDFFDAAMSPRAWRASMGIESAMDLLNEGAGRRFDPDLVMPFTTMLRQARIKRMAMDRPVVEVEAVSGLEDSEAG